MEQEFTVLIVDDDADQAQNLQDILEAEGYSTRLAPDGQTALALSRKKAFGLGLIDIGLPDIPGVELIEKLASISPDMEYIIITGHATLQTAVEAVRLKNMIAYETKPPNMDYLLALVKQVAERKQVEAALQESETFNASLLNNSPSPLLVLNPDTSIKYVNPALEKLTGYSIGEVIGLKVPHPWRRKEAAEEAAEKTKEMMEFGSQELESLLEKKNGELFWVDVTATPVFENGKLSYLLANWVDVTERKRAEEALRKSEQNFRNSLDSSPLGCRIYSDSGELLYANQAIVDIYGYSSIEEMNGTVKKQRLTAKSYAESTDRLEKTKRDEPLPSQYEIDIIRKDGQVRRLEAFPTRVIWDNQKQTQIIYQDVTERKQMEAALQESEQNFRASLDDSPLAIFITEGRGKILYANRSMIELFGYSNIEEMKNTPSTRRYTAEYQSILQERWDKRERGEFVPEHREHDIIRADGEIRHVEVFTQRTLWNGKERFQIIYQDITERKQLEEQFRHSQVLASLGEMTAGIAHEVGNPLASILLYSEAAMKGNASGQTRKDLRVIHNEAKRAGKLMKDLLAYSRKLEPKLRRLNLHDLVKKVLDMRQYQQKVQNIGTATYLLQGPLYVQGDPSQLTQVFLNLILNAEEAIKESKGRHIEVTSRIDGEWAAISIADDGIGIPEEHLNQVFHPFFTTKKIGEGTGLGLSTCYGIVTAQGGLIRAENNEMGGATFTVQLPLAGKQRQGLLPTEMGEASS